ncbi:MAG: acetate kinase [Candidatus Makana argininalis]
MKLILVLNCGSSSIKFSVINVINNFKYISGYAECLNIRKSILIYNYKNNCDKISLGDNCNHKKAILFIVNNILKTKKDILNNIIGIGHRIVHGGEKFSNSVLINKDVIKGIKNSIPFAPLHNPSHLIGIYESLKSFPNLSNKNVAVFDTSFHHTIPEESYLYPIPYFLYKNYKIRRYGAHGTSNLYIILEVKKILKKKKNINLIICHLGNGSSISAIRNGKCVDTSMGMTPLEGLVMGTRSGDIDPSIIFYLKETLGFSNNYINEILTKKSGLLGLTEYSSDFRFIEKYYFLKKNARRAMNVYCHRLAKYIGSYSSLMNGRLDALIFTGGIGENSYLVRKLTLNRLNLLGFNIDNIINKKICFGQQGIITKKNSLKSIVIPTKEDLVIAHNTSFLINKFKY